MNEQGDETVLRPGFALLFWWMTRTAKPGDFVEPAAQAAGASMDEPITTAGT